MISLSEKAFEDIEDGLERPFYLIGKPLVRTGLYATEEKLHFLLSAHHIILDGMGINAILNTIVSLYEGHEELQTDIFFSWLERQKELKETAFYKEAEKYLEDSYGKDEWCNNLKPDHCIDELSDEQKEAMSVIKMYTVVFPDDLGQKLEKEYGLTENGLFAAVILRALSKTERQENVMINWVFSNRNSPAEERSAGILMKVLPLGVKIREDTDDGALFKEVALKIRKGIEHSVFDWGINDEQAYLNDALFMVYESDILDVNALQKYDASEDFICDPLAPAIRRSSVQVMKTDEGFEMIMYYTAGLYTDEHLDAFHAAIRTELEKLGCSMAESELE